MMGYLDRLKGANSEKCPPLPLSKPPKAPYGSFDSNHGARFQKITPLVRPADDAATASRWWLIHYPDRNPVEVASFPPATHAEVLERHPDAIAAEPIKQAIAEPAWNREIDERLENLIVGAGTRWEYSPDDYALIREVARRDPDGLRLALENDVAACGCPW